MRTSTDIYKLPDGRFVEVDPITGRPANGILWDGYDYINQYWVYNGKRDTRTIEELRQSIREEESEEGRD